ncbi:MAG TPA: YgiT-type zinc finger protein [Candidatus Tectomicrobia bacterium]
MRCHVCGATMEATVTTLPFKVRDRTIIIIKGVPVRQCTRCSEYLLEDAVMAQVDRILAQVNAAAELAVIEFAA